LVSATIKVKTIKELTSLKQALRELAALGEKNMKGPS
jgi:hypothetical protein